MASLGEFCRELTRFILFLQLQMVLSYSMAIEPSGRLIRSERSPKEFGAPRGSIRSGSVEPSLPRESLHPWSSLLRQSQPLGGESDWSGALPGPDFISEEVAKERFNVEEERARFERERARFDQELSRDELRRNLAEIKRERERLEEARAQMAVENKVHGLTEPPSGMDARMDTAPLRTYFAYDGSLNLPEAHYQDFKPPTATYHDSAFSSDDPIDQQIAQQREKLENDRKRLDEERIWIAKQEQAREDIVKEGAELENEWRELEAERSQFKRLSPLQSSASGRSNELPAAADRQISSEPSGASSQPMTQATAQAAPQTATATQPVIQAPAQAQAGPQTITATQPMTPATAQAAPQTTAAPVQRVEEMDEEPLQRRKHLGEHEEEEEEEEEVEDEEAEPELQNRHRKIDEEEPRQRPRGHEEDPRHALRVPPHHMGHNLDDELQKKHRVRRTVPDIDVETVRHPTRHELDGDYAEHHSREADEDVSPREAHSRHNSKRVFEDIEAYTPPAQWTSPHRYHEAVEDHADRRHRYHYHEHHPDGARREERNTNDDEADVVQRGHHHREERIATDDKAPTTTMPLEAAAIPKVAAPAVVHATTTEVPLSAKPATTVNDVPIEGPEVHALEARYFTSTTLPKLHAPGLDAKPAPSNVTETTKRRAVDEVSRSQFHLVHNEAERSPRHNGPFIGW